MERGRAQMSKGLKKPRLNSLQVQREKGEVHRMIRFPFFIKAKFLLSADCLSRQEFYNFMDVP